MKTSIIMALALLCVGCATRWVEQAAVERAVLAGYRLDGAVPGSLRAPEGSSEPGITRSQAAWKFMPLEYFLASTFNYVVLPAGGIAGAAWLFDYFSDKSEDEEASVEINNAGGDVYYVRESSDVNQRQDNSMSEGK